MRRLVGLAFVILGVTLITFYLSRGVPGISPLAAYITFDTPPSDYPDIVRAHHLDEPLYVQYFYYMRDLLRGDWGFSQAAGLPVVEALRRFFPATLELALVAILLSLAIGIPLGIISALRNGRLPDHVSRLTALTGVSMPIFWLGLLLQLGLFYYLRTAGLPHLPSSGRVSGAANLAYPLGEITGLYLFDSLITGNLPFFTDAVSHIILPAVTLTFVQIALISRIMRSSMLEVLRQEYILFAKSKGLVERVITYRHALKNALLPVVTVTGIAFGNLLGGAVLTETVFAWPGMGRWAAQAILANDTAAIMGVALVASIVFVIVNFIADLVYSALDPRVKY